MILTLEDLKKIVTQVEDQNEVNRRALAKRRHDIYRDGGQNYLMEQLRREFSATGVKEMRPCPMNFLKKVVNKTAKVYKRPPTRKCSIASDQKLVDYYTKKLGVNQLMQKANRYLVLAANTTIYPRPFFGELKIDIVPNFQYSVMGNKIDQTKIDGVIFSNYVQEGLVTPNRSVLPATGVEGYSQERGYEVPGQLIDSQGKSADPQARNYILWTDDQHFTLDGEGNPIVDPELGDEQFLNPIELNPCINLARDRDNESWATQGEEMVQVALLLQSVLTDEITIAKHGGFPIMVWTSTEKPQEQQIGLNKGIWLKPTPDCPNPTVAFVNPNAPIAEYSDLMLTVLSLYLSTNSVEAGSVSGKSNVEKFTSGFDRLIAMADSLEVIEEDQPLMSKAEQDMWRITGKWHNWMLDQDTLNEDARALGTFSEEFIKNSVELSFPEIRPLQSEDERLSSVERQMKLGIMTRLEAVKKMNPDLDDSQAKKKLLEIDAENEKRIKEAQAAMGENQNGNVRNDQGQQNNDQEIDQEEA